MAAAPARGLAPGGRTAHSSAWWDRTNDARHAVSFAGGHVPSLSHRVTRLIGARDGAGSLPFLERTILTVSEVSERIKIVLEDTFFDIWVEGEISNLRTPSSGHSYLTLKDEHSQIRAVLFKMQRRYLRFDPKDGCWCSPAGGFPCMSRVGNTSW